MLSFNIKKRETQCLISNFVNCIGTSTYGIEFNQFCLELNYQVNGKSIYSNYVLGDMPSDISDIYKYGRSINVPQIGGHVGMQMMNLHLMNIVQLIMELYGNFLR